MADGQQAIQLIREHFPDAVVRSGEACGQHWAELKLQHLVEVCRWLKDDPAPGYEYLVDVTAAHWPDDPRPIEMVYHLFSIARNDRLRLKARASEGERVPSLAGVWKSAEWNERETYDMFGILMPDDYTDHPLRKEFPLYRG